MMPDLGKYATAVLSSYAAAIALLVLLVLITLYRGRKARRDLQQIEDRQVKNG